MSFVSKLLGAGKRSGPANPYSPVDFNHLYSTAGAKPPMFDYTGVMGRTAPYFNQLLQGVDVTNSANNDNLQNLLKEIGLDTDQAIGKTTSDMYKRGLTGAGTSSDIAEIGKAQAADQGQRASANARTQTLLGNAQNLQNALGSQYQTATGLSSQGASQDASAMADYYNRLLGIGQLQSGAYSAGVNANQAGRQGSYFQDFLRYGARGAGQQGGQNAADYGYLKLLGLG